MSLHLSGRTKIQPLVIPVKEHNSQPTEHATVGKLFRAYFAILHFVFALDYGFMEHSDASLSFVFRVFPICSSVGISFAMIYYIITTNYELSAYYLFLSFKFIISALILFSFRKITFKNFIVSLYEIDKRMDVINKLEVQTVICLSLMLLTISLQWAINVLMFFKVKNIAFVGFILLPFISVTLPSIVMSFVFYNILLRLRSVEYDVANIEHFDVLVYLRIYKELGDLLEEMGYSMNKLYICTLLYNFPIVVSSIAYLVQNLNTTLILQTSVSVLMGSIEMYGPAFTAGMMTSQAELITVALHNRRLKEREDADTQFDSQMESFIKYTKMRGFRVVVMRLVPLGWSLPVIVLNITITYTIAILQFTHTV